MTEIVKEALQELIAMSPEEFEALPDDDEWKDFFDDAIATGFHLTDMSRYYRPAQAPAEAVG